MPRQENQRSAIDGGLFRAVYDEEAARFQRWTHEGHSGRVMARTGFDVDAGALDQRLSAFARRTQLLIAAAG